MQASRFSILARVGLVAVMGLAASSGASTHESSGGGSRAIVDARHLEFRASADDDKASNGQPLLDHYALVIFLAGGASPLQTVDLGKPEAEHGDTIRMDFVSRLAYPLTPGLTYEVVVQAVGPGGSSDSERSNPFTFSPPPCDPWISPSSMEVGADAGSGIVTVNAGEGCAWRAVSDDPWLTITAGASGTGNGTTTFTVAANGDHDKRHGTLSVAGSKFRIEQAECPVVEHPRPHPWPEPHAQPNWQKHESHQKSDKDRGKDKHGASSQHDDDKNTAAKQK